jgi:hypothetical protein
MLTGIKKFADSLRESHILAQLGRGEFKNSVARCNSEGDLNIEADPFDSSGTSEILAGHYDGKSVAIKIPSFRLNVPPACGPEFWNVGGSWALWHSDGTLRHVSRQVHRAAGLDSELASASVSFARWRSWSSIFPSNRAPTLLLISRCLSPLSTK